MEILILISPQYFFQILSAGGCFQGEMFVLKNILCLILHLLYFIWFSGGIFFSCYLAALRPTSGHCRGASLANPILITLFFCSWFHPKVTGSLGTGIGILGLVSSGVSLTSWGEGASLALVGHPTSDGVTIKIPYRVDVLLHRPAWHQNCSYWVG